MAILVYLSQLILGRPRIPSARPWAAGGRRRVVAALVLFAAIAGSARCGGSRDAEVEAAYRECADALRRHDYPAAVEAGRRAVKLDETHADAWFDLGVAEARLENWTESIEAYSKAIELDPDNAKALNNLANVYFRQGRDDVAEQWYARALDVDPDYLLATFHHGWVLRQLNRLGESENAFRHCLELPAPGEREQRTHLDCLFYLGSIRFRQGDYAEAARIMEQVLRAWPAHAEARHFLGLSYRQLGRYDDAVRELELHRQMVQARRSIPIPEPDEP